MKRSLSIPCAVPAAKVGWPMAFVGHDLPPAISGGRRDLASRAGRLSYYHAGPANMLEPLLLIHSVNAAASAYEVRPLYELYCKTRTVYALELPGFGFSQRGDRDYTPRLMTDAILAVVAEIARIHSGRPIDALAISLSSEFLARAAVELPEAFRTIAMVSPTGFVRNMPKTAPPESIRAMPALRRILTFPLWSRTLFDLLASKPSIRFFLRKTWGSKQIDEGLAEYDYLTAHQPGAQYATYSFVSGYLFSLDISRIYRAIAQPVWMVYGVRGDFTDYTGASEFEALPNWRIYSMPTGAMPHFENLGLFTRLYDAFLAQPPS